jgi:hypothetical protein
MVFNDLMFPSTASEVKVESSATINFITWGQSRINNFLRQGKSETTKSSMEVHCRRVSSHNFGLGRRSTREQLEKIKIFVSQNGK